LTDVISLQEFSNSVRLFNPILLKADKEKSEEQGLTCMELPIK